MLKYFWIAVMMLFSVLGCQSHRQEKALQAFLETHVDQIKNRSKQSALAYWEAATTGTHEAYDRFTELDMEIRQIYSNRNDFTQLEGFKKSGKIKDPLLLRQLDVLYHAYLANQIEPDLLREIVDGGTQIEKKFSTFRGTIRGKKTTANDIDEILKTELDSKKRELAWSASKQVGAYIAADLINLVKLRNRAAQQLGFDNFFTFSLTVSDLDVAELDAIFESLSVLTEGPFLRLKAELDSLLAQKYHIPPTKIMPWHYHDPFFQETPLVFELDLDKYYQNRDVRELGAQFFRGIDLPVDGILDQSDLYERDGKNPHAFCTDIDREGNVRVLLNLRNNERWMETLLHELGHAVYDKYLDPKTPFLLRTQAHAFTTEAVAMFFGRLSRDVTWFGEMLNLEHGERENIAPVCQKYAQLKQMIFTRWAMVMYYFEKALYADPDQDLNALWWQQVEKYQFIPKPERRNAPDWAAKIHFSIAPCYYHNYLLGELLASQFYIHLQKTLGDPSGKLRYVNNARIGEYFKTRVFRPGATLSWNHMIAQATGEPLNPKYFVEQFVRD